MGQARKAHGRVLNQREVRTMKRSINRSIKSVKKLLLSLILVCLICGGSLRVNAAALYGTAAAGGAAVEKTDTDDGAAKTEGPVGIWKLAELTGENPVSKEDVQQYESLGQVIVYLEIREDGSFMMSLFQEEIDGTWDADNLTVEGESIPYTISGDTLSLQNPNGDEMLFDRSSKEELDSIQGYKEGVLDETVSYTEEEQTILNIDEASLIITGYKADKKGFTVSLKCENKTDHRIMLSAVTCVLNKYAISQPWAISLEGNESKDSEMTFSIFALEKCGISAIDEMILEIKAIDAEDWTTFEEGTVTAVYPTGKKPEEIKAAERAPAENEKVVVDNEYCSFIIEGAAANHALGYAVNCYCENKTEDTLTFMWSEEYLNDQDVTGLFAQKLLPGTRGFADALFMQNGLEQSGIKTDEIKSVRARLKVYDSELNVVADVEFTYQP